MSSVVGSQPGALFACTKCNGRYPFEELSHAQQLCKDCRGSMRTVKCTYCRTEFQSESKSNSATICKKCENNVKSYGKPRSCEYCNIIAAFIGNKCQRCSNSEKKYGPPQDCEMCKQRCAFDRRDSESRKKLFDGKLLCWLCTISAKRALTKAKQNDTSIRHTSITSLKPSSSSGGHGTSSGHNRHKEEHKSGSHRSGHGSNSGHRSSSSRVDPILGNLSGNNGSSETKRPRIEGQGSKTNGLSLPSGSSAQVSDNNDHMNITATTQLKEQLLLLQKQISKKDSELLEKDKKYSELKAVTSREEKEWREKLNNLTKSYNEKIEGYQRKISDLQKQNATLTKQIKEKGNKGSSAISKVPFDPRPLESPSDSPS